MSNIARFPAAAPSLQTLIEREQAGNFLAELIPDGEQPIDCFHSCPATAIFWVTASALYPHGRDGGLLDLDRVPLCKDHAHVEWARWAVGS